MSAIIAVDVGGTQMRAALYDQGKTAPSHFNRINTRDKNAAPLERLIQLIKSVWPEKDNVQAIGIASPGPLDSRQGIIIAAPNIAGWTDFPLKKRLEEYFDVPVSLGNDANLAAYGEWRYGAGKGHHHLVYMTISTGIGGGIIADDQLLIGLRGMAAELGHVTILPDGPMCGCGQRGHLEAIASGTAIAKWVAQELSLGAASTLPIDRPISAKLIAQAALRGDELATAALARSGAYIGQALADYLHIFNPSIVIIGGGVSQSGALIMDPIRTAMNEHVLTDKYLEGLTLTTAALGDEAGLMGALALVRDTFPEIDK